MEFILVVDNIRSLHNVGSLLRTADGAGVSRVYLCGMTPTPVDRFGRVRQAVSKVSLGAEEYVHWEYRERVVDMIAELKAQGIEVVALEQSDDSVLYNHYNPTSQVGLALVVGNEVSGVGEEVLALVDSVVEIPMQGKKKSLNVAVAGAVALFSLREKLA